MYKNRRGYVEKVPCPHKPANQPIRSAMLTRLFVLVPAELGLMVVADVADVFGREEALEDDVTSAGNCGGTRSVSSAAPVPAAAGIRGSI